MKNASDALPVFDETFFRRTITVWWRTGKILAVFFQFLSVYICLGVIVRLQFQFSSKRGECDCSSRGGGQ